MALKRHRRMRANPVELLVVNPGRPRVSMSHRHNPEWARSLGRGLYRGTRYAAESARDLYHGAREAHRAHRATVSAAAPTMNPGRKPKKKRKNPVAMPKRDRSGRFVSKARVKKKAKKKGITRGSFKISKSGKATISVRRENPSSPPRRRRRAKLKSNPVRRRRRHMAENPAAPKRRKRRNPRRRHARKNPLSKRFQKRAARTVKVLRKRSKKAPKRSLRRRALSAQVRRAGTILALAKARAPAKKIRTAIRGLQHAMITKSNPGFAGVVAAAKILAPQAAVGGLGLVGLAMAGKYVADMIVMEKDAAGNAVIKKSFLADENDPTKGASTVSKYIPALSTAGLSLVGYMVADKVAPRFKGAVMIGGMIGAIVQAVMASVEADKPDSVAAKVKAALLPMPSVAVGEYTTVGAGIFHGVGEYTTVGSGIFHGVGEYTAIGSGADNATEFAADSLRGLDDASQFAPGEGGVLSGGIFK